MLKGNQDFHFYYQCVSAPILTTSNQYSIGPEKNMGRPLTDSSPKPLNHLSDHIPAGLCGCDVKGTWCPELTGRHVWSGWCRSLSVSAEYNWVAEPLRESQRAPHLGLSEAQSCRQAADRQMVSLFNMWTCTHMHMREDANRMLWWCYCRWW